MIHSRKWRRYRCKRCGQTFSPTRDTALDRLRHPVEVVVTVVTLLAYGCPLQAIVAAFGLDERTVAAWQARAGQQCQAVHAHLVATGHLDVQHVQADELWVKLVGKRVWMAMALAVPSRLWLGGVVRSRRDLRLISALVQAVRRCALTSAFLVCVDGLASYVTAFRRVFRTPVHTGRRGRARLVAAPGLLIGQVLQQYAQRPVVGVTRRVVQGPPEAIHAVLAATRSGTDLKTASMERLNAPFRSSLAPLARRGRALVHRAAALTAGMDLVGCAYNFCWVHASLRLPTPKGATRTRRDRTPAMAAGLTDHPWTMSELLHYPVPLPAGVAPKRRGRPPRAPQHPALARAA